jgi:plastocyanin
MHRSELAKKRRMRNLPQVKALKRASRRHLVLVSEGQIILTLFAIKRLLAAKPDLGTLNPDLLGAAMSSSNSAGRAVRIPSFLLAFLIFSCAFGPGALWSAQVRAEDTHEVEISIKDHKFTPEALKLPAGKAIKILVKNLDASAEEFESQDLGFEKVIPGNSSASVRVKPLKPGTYMFFGEFHQDTALGHVVVE